MARNPYKPMVARDYDGWAVLLDGRWQPRKSWQAAVDTALARCDQHRDSGCPKGCPCRIPGPVCGFRGRLLEDERFCPRCGWSPELHEDTAPADWGAAV